MVLPVYSWFFTSGNVYVVKTCNTAAVAVLLLFFWNEAVLL